MSHQPLWDSVSLPTHPTCSSVHALTYLLAHTSIYPIYLQVLLENLPFTEWSCCHFSRVHLFATPWTAAHGQVPLSMGFFRQEHWSGLPCPLPGDLLDSGIEPMSLTSPALAGRFFTTSAIWEAHQFTSCQMLCKVLWLQQTLSLAL